MLMKNRKLPSLGFLNYVASFLFGAAVAAIGIVMNRRDD
jgi:hypothetical protein